jgi:hypothetical protein
MKIAISAALYNRLDGNSVWLLVVGKSPIYRGIAPFSWKRSWNRIADLINCRSDKNKSRAEVWKWFGLAAQRFYCLNL